jgi:hypothetical protein
MINQLIKSYIRPKSWENDGRIYEQLGVKAFFKITPFELRRALTGKKPKPLKNKRDVKRYYRDTILAELTHLFSFLFILGVSLYIGFTGGFRIAVVIMVINILANLYPIFLMRYNRGRLRRVVGETII